MTQAKLSLILAQGKLKIKRFLSNLNKKYVFSGLVMRLKPRCSTSSRFSLKNGDTFSFAFNSRAGFFRVYKNNDLQVMIEEELPPDIVFYPYAKLYGVGGEEIELINCIESHTDHRNDFLSFNTY